jgi:DNA topoisomerase I
MASPPYVIATLSSKVAAASVSTSVASMALSIMLTCATSALHPSFGAVRNCRDRSCSSTSTTIGTPHAVGSEDVNEYLRAIAGAEITAKDFRTWAATNLAALALRELETFDSQTKAKRNVMQAVEAVSKMLGNTPAICQKCYIHPAIFDGYLDGSLLQALKRRADAKLANPRAGLKAEEAAVTGFLSRQLAATNRA